MSEEGKKTTECILEIISNLPEPKKERILGIAEGMAIMKEANEEDMKQKAG